MLKRTTFLLNQWGFFEDVVTGLASGNYKVWFSKTLKVGYLNKVYPCSTRHLDNSTSHSFAALIRELSSWTLEKRFHNYARPCFILYNMPSEITKRKVIEVVIFFYNRCFVKRKRNLLKYFWTVCEKNNLIKKEYES